MDEILGEINPTIYIPKYGHTVTTLDIDEREIEFVAGMFPRGRVSAIVAESGIGKTWVLVASSLSVTSGIPFLPSDNYTTSSDQRVLVVDTEGRIRTFVQRIDLLGGDRQYYITPKSPLEIAVFSNPEDRETIELILQNEDIALMFIDSFAGFSSVDENTCQVLESLQWLSKLALKYDVAVVFTQLINKAELREGRITTKSVRGFSGIPQWAEIIWGLDTPTGDSSVKRLYQVKNNIEQKNPTDFIFELKDGGIVWKTQAVLPTKETRFKIMRENLEDSNIAIARKILELEPDTKLKSLEVWVAKNRAKIPV